MEQKTADQLHAEGLISDNSFARLKQQQLNPLLSVHWEVRTLLYLGILLLTSGLGILVYKNIDSIGHGVVLAFIALVTAGCFAYCVKLKAPFSTGKVQAPTAFFDYILLLGTLCLVIFIGYLQYQYHVFGTHYGMAAFIPMVLLFFIAYYFDHVGVLNMAIINLGLWLGVSVLPRQLFAAGRFNNEAAVFTYLGFGLLLIAAAWATQRNNFKAHFNFSYLHYGIHAGFIALLAGYFLDYDSGFSMLWLLALFVLAALLYNVAFKQKSFYFLLLVILYSYVAISCLVVRAAIFIGQLGAVYLLFIYFILSAIGLIYLLIHLNKKLKAV